MSTGSNTTVTSSALHHGQDGRATVRVRLFAAIRDAAGVDVVVVQANTIAEVAEQLRKRWPAVSELIGRSRFAVNQAFASQDAALGEADEIAVIPPVSGG